MFKKIIEKLQYGSCKIKVDADSDTAIKIEKEFKGSRKINGVPL